MATKVSLGAYMWGGWGICIGVCVSVRCIQMYMREDVSVRMGVRRCVCVCVAGGCSCVRVSPRVLLRIVWTDAGVGGVGVAKAEPGSGRWHVLPFPWRPQNHSNLTA